MSTCSGFPSIHNLLWGKGPKLWTHFSLSRLCQGLLSLSTEVMAGITTGHASLLGVIWAETGMEATESQVLPDLADDSWL